MQSYLISDTLVNPILTVLWTWSWSYSPWLTKHKYLQDVFRIHIRGCQVRVGAISALKRSLNIDRLGICPQQDVSNVRLPARLRSDNR